MPAYSTAPKSAANPGQPGRPARREQLASAAEVAAFLGGDFSEKTLANWRSLGKGPRSIKIGGSLIRYDWADVRKWLELQRREGGA